MQPHGEVMIDAMDSYRWDQVGRFVVPGGRLVDGRAAHMTAHRQVELARAYDEARPRLLRVAYAVLGSNTDAEDVVSDGWLRLTAADDREPILDVGAWATVTVARLALDLLQSARVRREQ